MPWVKYDGETLTFQYGEKGSLGDNEYVLNMAGAYPSWCGHAREITKVVFDASFKNARPVSCCGWFGDCVKLTSIEGIENLNTSEVTDMSHMFSNCVKLPDLDVSHFKTSNVADMSYMFSFCTSLKSLYVSDKFTTENVNTSTSMFQSCEAAVCCLPKDYATVCGDALLSGRLIRIYVSIRPEMEYGTICVPVGCDLSVGNHTGFDKLYTIDAIESYGTEKGCVVLKEAESLTAGVPYVYRHNVAGDGVKAEITYQPNTSSIDFPLNGGLLKGTFESVKAPVGSYVLAEDGKLHLVAADNTTVIDEYNAYVKPDFLEAIEGMPKTLLLKFDGEATGIKGVPGTNGIADHPVYYDLMGRTVKTPVKGRIYVRNGKKVLKN